MKKLFFPCAVTALISILLTSLTMFFLFFGADIFPIKAMMIENIIESRYYEDVDKAELKEGAYYGLASAVGDTYTRYLNPQSSEMMGNSTEGNDYKGVGVTITTNSATNEVVVIAVTEKSPGDKAGLMVGDCIIKVEDFIASGDVSDELVGIMKGINPDYPDDAMDFLIKRDGTEIPVTITREIVDQHPVSSNIYDNIGYIRVTGFDKSMLEKFRQHYTDVSKADGLIIDLRDNPGGTFEEAIRMSDMFLKDELIVYTEDKYGKQKKYYGSDESYDSNIAILINGGSASASEVVAGALRDNNRAALIGTNSFGKGIVQDVVKLFDGTMVQVTSAKYYTPNGVCIHQQGIAPDIEIKLPESAQNKLISRLTPGEDTQLAAAITYLKSR